MDGSGQVFISCLFISLLGGKIWTVNVFESLDVVWKTPRVLNLQYWSNARVDPRSHFGYVVPNIYFSPVLLKLFNWGVKKSVPFVTCNNSPDGMLVLSLLIYSIHDNNPIEFHKSMYSNSHCIRISASCCCRETPASKPQVYCTCQQTWQAWQRLTTGSFAQGYSGVKGLFLPCKLWNGGVEGICENVNCLAI